MLKRILLLSFLISVLYSTELTAQETLGGIGIYPTGTETGFGYRSSKNTRLAADVRITKANLYTKPLAGAFINEASLIYRVVYYEKVRFHIGLGGRADWNFTANQSHRFGVVTPLGIEAFPFPFQNAGLFFEAAPYFTWTVNGNNPNLGLRTVAGFVFYFVKKEKEEIKN